ncbi:hypothetical protein HELRODRAFT_185045 [Helobdella robusta]|uniref:Toll-interacting protein n=1 Tax=Helobdella robusta TaxID=6412 RepID=T1FMB8_HELRO|nr:hypothetical protein HELRODRAFT_185045 [Helobdella robusta]ESN98998.1 hypothetical protein HELRODRAFT_185045 [Helobdella robusta]
MESAVNSETAVRTVQTTDRRQQVMIGTLPDDFLRVSNGPDHHDPNLYAQFQNYQQPVQTVSRLSVTIAQATLVKNYGLTKMDPYVRLRVGNSVVETHTAVNGGKSPVWNKVFIITLQPGIDSIYLEIFDERSFALDDKIAWAHIVIPEQIFSGETVDEWYQLSGKQGEQKEGSINIIFSHSMAPVRLTYSIPNANPGLYPLPHSQQIVMVPAAGVPMMAPYYQSSGVVQPMYSYYPTGQQQIPSSQQYPQQGTIQQSPQQAPQQAPQPTAEDIEKDVDMLVEMFPGFERAIIQSMLEDNRFNKESTINQLLSISS